MSLVFLLPLKSNVHSQCTFSNVLRRELDDLARKSNLSAVLPLPSDELFPAQSLLQIRSPIRLKSRKRTLVSVVYPSSQRTHCLSRTHSLNMPLSPSACLTKKRCVSPGVICHTILHPCSCLHPLTLPTDRNCTQFRFLSSLTLVLVACSRIFLSLLALARA